MKILYFDCFYGIGAEGCLKALIDLGVDNNYIQTELNKMGQVLAAYSGEFEISFKEAFDLLIQSKLKDDVKEIAIRVIRVVEEAYCRLKERNIHLEPGVIAQKDFKNIIQIAICIDFLKPDKIVTSKVETGTGSRNINNRIVPIPSPLTMEVLRGVSIKNDCEGREAINVIGAAIISSITDEYNERKDFNISKIGYAASGEGLLRVYSADIEEINNSLSSGKDADTGCAYDRQYILECNIDDMNSEIYDIVMTKLFRAGAADAYFTPIMMKKGRPAIKVSVLCSEDRVRDIEELLFMETTTFGIRRYEVEKTMLKRSFSKVETKYGEITVKRGFYKGNQIKAKPEHDECRKIAEELGIPISEVYREAWKHI